MAKSALAAFPLIAEDLPQLCQKLVDFPPCNFWIHETKLAQHLNLPQGPEHGPCQALSAILACMRNGFGGNKRKRTQVFTGFDGVDLMNQNNNLGICYQQWGKREAFPRGTLSDAPLMREPRWFKFGNNCKIEVAMQIEIAKELTGDVTLGNALEI